MMKSQSTRVPRKGEERKFFFLFFFFYLFSLSPFFSSAGGDRTTNMTNDPSLPEVTLPTDRSKNDCSVLVQEEVPVNDPLLQLFSYCIVLSAGAGGSCDVFPQMP